jgi:hypothetical protein
MAVTIVSMGPFHVLYAPEARPYMMFAVLVLLLNAILLRAIALQKSPAIFKYTSKLSKAVWSIRWALFNRLKETGLPVVTGSGGLAKFNRTRLELLKTH